MNLRRAFWGLGTAGFYALAAPAQSPEPLPPAPPLEQSVQVLLATLRERGQLSTLTADQREQVLASILEVLDLRAEPTDPAKPAAFSGPITVRGLYAYFRLEHLGAGLAAAVKAAMTDVAAGHYAAVILDLRGSTGTAQPDAAQAFAPLREATVPVACLIDGRTASAAAELAASLRQNEHAILVGQPALPPGQAAELVTLATGERVWLPAVPPPGTVAPAAIQPDVLVRDPRIGLVTFETADPANWSALAARDEALRRAVDLLTATRILHQP